MYSIYADGKLLFATNAVDDEHIVLSPRLQQETDEAGSLTFDLPPGNILYDGIGKLKSIITVEQGGKTIFRGRAMDDEKDFYNQKNVYCEGDLSFLLDSIYAPDIYNGKVKAYFKLLIEKHNEQVDPEKRFAIGVIDAVDDETPYEATERVETRVYWDTLAIIKNRLIGPYGGYLRTRTEGGVTYIDWLKKSGDINGQIIEFSVNLLDLKNKVDASEVFTVLLPLGYSEIDDDGNYGDPLTIASVNNGLDYIQDDAAVALYGKIWRTKTWSQEKDPSALLTKAREFMKTGIAVQTLTLKAIDMHFISGSADAIQIGQYVRILSQPHGLDITLPCTKIDIDLMNPENTTYTFGEKPKTLTENVVRAEEEVSELTGSGRGGGGGRSIQEEASDILRWAKINVDEDKAKIELLAGESFESIDGTKSLKEAYVDIDGAQTKIALVAGQTYENIDGSKNINQAYINIDGAKSKISLMAGEEFDNIDGSKSLSKAYINIDGAKSKISLMAGEEFDNIDGSKSLSKAYINIDGAKSKIALVAGQEFDAIDGTKTLNQAYIRLDAQDGVIEQKVSKDGVISSINQSAEAVTINASKINLNGYVTASQLETEFTNFNSGISQSLYVSALSCNGFSCSSFEINGYGMSLKSATFLTSSTTLTVISTGGTVTNVDLNKKTNTIYYYSWE